MTGAVVPGGISISIEYLLTLRSPLGGEEKNTYIYILSVYKVDNNLRRKKYKLQDKSFLNKIPILPLG